MRITNKIMSNNTLNNLNKNKLYLDKLNNQMASEKKITRPSDDPIIAIRALRLRGSLAEVTQYYDKNVKDATAWLQATQGAVDSTLKVVTSIKAEFTSGSNGTNTVESREAILEELKSLRDQIYANGDAEYAGRTLFTGYRTSSNLMFKKDEAVAYKDITETFNASDLEQITYVSGKLDMTDDVVSYTTSTTTELDVEKKTVSRLRLAYDDLDLSQVKSLTYRTSFTPTSEFGTGGSVTIKDETGAILYNLTRNADGDLSLPGGGTDTITKNEDGTYTIDNGSGKKINLTASGKIINGYQETVVAVTTKSIANGNTDDAYNVADGAIHLIPETGELIIGKDLANTLSSLKDINSASTIEFSYDKADWRKGDLRPEHYFKCKDTTNNIDYDTYNQDICYDVSANQTMRINTYASDLFVHAIGRDVNEMVRAIEDVDDAQKKVDELQTKLQDTALSDADRAKLERLLEAAKKEMTSVSDKMQKMFESGQTSFEGYVKQVTLAGTQVGSRISRLELVSNRLLDLKTSVRDLADENENVDIINIGTEVKSASLIYEAALLATGKISQQTLLNYI